MSFKKGQQVKFTTIRGRAGAGVISALTETAKGLWITVKSADGSETKVRPAHCKVA